MAWVTICPGCRALITLAGTIPEIIQSQILASAPKRQVNTLISAPEMLLPSGPVRAEK